MNSAFRQRLKNSRVILLDGATGTELARRGADLNSPSWSASVLIDQPDLLVGLHRDYVTAGAEVITANTFRTHARSLKCLGRAHDAALLTERAVELARTAAEEATDRQVFVAGSMAPLEDCYSPELTPSEQELAGEHGLMAEALARAGVDFVLIETQITIREARVAADAVHHTGLPFGVSLVANRNGKLLSGETLADAFQAVVEFQPDLLMVNCVPANEVLGLIAPLQSQFTGVQWGAYANTGRLMPNGSWESTDAAEPAVYAGYARRWMSAKFSLVGGCCGTSPSHVSAMREIL